MASFRSLWRYSASCCTTLTRYLQKRRCRRLFFRPRSWCVYCPMGTMTQGICRLRNRKTNNQKENLPNGKTTEENCGASEASGQWTPASYFMRSHGGQPHCWCNPYAYDCYYPFCPVPALKPVESRRNFILWKTGHERIQTRGFSPEIRVTKSDRGDLTLPFHTTQRPLRYYAVE